MMRALFAFFIIFAGLIPSAFAADAPAWTIVAPESKIHFEGTQMGALFKGEFKSFEGTIRFDPANLEGSSARIAIATDSVDTDSADRNSSIRMPDWLSVTQFPQAEFVTTGFQKGLAPDQYVASGHLTLRGVTLPVTLPFTLSIAKGDAGSEVAQMTGETTLNRLDFGVGQGEWKDTKSVGNEVRVSVSLKAVRQP